ncbi:FAD-dependent oxidoreductase [Endozoicomonas arenosclerae]|uniref:FAD-dependent oxidoreductase n=1 Tax=Endozoicomonas arenosclerae TaxID=1633495 RepID=UPI0007833FE3|nr:NAD(P)/FAD-dependent oxidoreductase [Endozoicomonas arenosclerae]
MNPSPRPQADNSERTEKIVIVGAGPAGLLLAHYLLQQKHYQITLFEKLPEPNDENLISQRTFPITLQLRGMGALKQIPELEEKVAQSGSWSKGTLMHGKKGHRTIPARSPLLLTHRNRLTHILLKALQSQYGQDRLRIEFETRCIALDEQSRTIVVENESEGQKTVFYDRLVATDGARSMIREHLTRQKKVHSTLQEVPNVYRNLEIHCPLEQQLQALSADHIHVWNMGKNARLMMIPQGEDILRGTLIFPRNQDPFQPLQSANDVKELFQRKCPELTSLIDLDVARQIFERPVSRNLTVRCDTMHVGGNILLLGDAVHAVSASIGQGCNSALQDVMVFSQLLEEHQENWDTALPEFTEKQLPNAHALRELSDFSYPQTSWLNAEFIFRVTLGKKLARWIPAFAKPLPSVLVANSTVPYKEVLEQTRWWTERVKKSLLH